MTWMRTSASHENMSGEQGGVAKMPGMATQEEITRLRSLTGKELDGYFLQLILRHHSGGAEMAQYVVEHAAQAQVRALASSIHRSQTVEMGTLRTMLTERGAQPLPS
jgi:uncharacterized protein (DUF305 family)